MISFIVPTLWKSNKIFESIKSFKETNIPNSEFIIIDNSNSDFEDDKIICLKQTENIGVNPAWNLGVRTAKNDLICLLNDDITFNFRTLNTNLTTIKTSSDQCLIGFDANQNFSDELNEDLEVLKFKKADCRSLGFGCMMIMSKKNYIFLDENMKTWCGDDMIYWWHNNKHNKIVYNISNFKVIGDLSITSRDYEESMNHDFDLFQQMVSKAQ